MVSRIKRRAQGSCVSLFRAVTRRGRKAARAARGIRLVRVETTTTAPKFNDSEARTLGGSGDTWLLGVW
jgi:hypothetical protein